MGELFNGKSLSQWQWLGLGEWATLMMMMRIWKHAILEGGSRRQACSWILKAPARTSMAGEANCSRRCWNSTSFAGNPHQFTTVTVIIGNCEEFLSDFCVQFWSILWFFFGFLRQFTALSSFEEWNPSVWTPRIGVPFHEPPTRIYSFSDHWRRETKKNVRIS